MNFRLVHSDRETGLPVQTCHYLSRFSTWTTRKILLHPFTNQQEFPKTFVKGKSRFKHWTLNTEVHCFTLNAFFTWIIENKEIYRIFDLSACDCKTTDQWYYWLHQDSPRVLPAWLPDCLHPVDQLLCHVTMPATVEPDLRYLVAQGWVWNQLNCLLQIKFSTPVFYKKRLKGAPNARESYYFPMDLEVHSFI